MKRAIIVFGGGIERSKRRFDGALSVYIMQNQDSEIITSGVDWDKFEENKVHIKKTCEAFNLNPKIIPEYDSTSSLENVKNSSKLIDDTEEVVFITESTQIAEVKRYAKRFLDGHKLRFYAVPERLNKYLPLHLMESVIGFLFSLMPAYNDMKLSTYWKDLKSSAKKEV